jgi:hypothetical protein
VCLAVIFVMLSPVIIFLVLPLATALYRRRLRSAACAFRCHSCDGILGLESLQLADAAIRELCSERSGSRYRVRFVRYLHAICPACGARYTFVERARTFMTAPAHGP